MILCGSLWEDLGEILLKSYLRGPGSKILKMLCAGGACMKFARKKFLYDDLYM